MEQLKKYSENGNGQTTVLVIKHLKKKFGSNNVLSDVNLHVYRGENLVVLGKSGSGKSVLIKCIVRLMEPDEGEIEILGGNIAKLKIKDLNDVRKKTGFLFQGSALYDSMTVRENLEFPLRELNLPQIEMDLMVKEALQNVGLLEAIDKMPSELSGGMRKRVGLARSLMLKPEIMFYDEPTTGLDPITAKEISRLIVKVQKQYSTTSIIITHDIDCARITANRIVVLSEGKCKAEGTFAQLKKSENELIHAFFE